MKSFNHAFNAQDEYYTPSCLVEIIIQDLTEWRNAFRWNYRREPIIWCPFDKPESKYVEILKKYGFEVIHSHIDEGKDFFSELPNFDIAISNPPFSKKVDVFKRLFGMQKPFMMLMNMMAINYQEVGKLFADHGSSIQFLIPDKKVSFNGKTSSFCSGYVCYGCLSKTKFIHMDNNNTGKNFRR